MEDYLAIMWKRLYTQLMRKIDAAIKESYQRMEESGSVIDL